VFIFLIDIFPIQPAIKHHRVVLPEDFLEITARDELLFVPEQRGKLLEVFA
jgi:hypothetical protein